MSFPGSEHVPTPTLAFLKTNVMGIRLAFISSFLIKRQHINCAFTNADGNYDISNNI